MKRSYKNLEGRRFGQLTVIKSSFVKANQRMWECVCDCGSNVLIASSNLFPQKGRPATISCIKCGHLRTAIALRQINIKHGHSRSRDGKKSRTYKTWEGVLGRCLYSGNASFKHYGAKGIKVCDRWLKFENFLEDMGKRPDGKTLDRIDPNGNYESGNCRWADKYTQANNRLNSNRVAYNGETRTVSEWSRELGINKHTLYNRVKKGLNFITGKRG